MEREKGRETTTCLGLFLVVLALYALFSPGRIDIIDGQIRFEVARNLIEMGEPILRDPAIMFMALPGRNGAAVSHYGLGPSVGSVPVLWLWKIVDGSSLEFGRFLFSLTSSLYGAGLAVVVYLSYRRLGITRISALGWTAVCATATLLWPLSATTFDQAQHAFLFGLCFFLVAFSGPSAGAGRGMAAGLSAGFLCAHHEYLFLLAFPLAFLPVFVRADRALSGARFRIGLLTGLLAGVIVMLALNWWRFGSPLESGQALRSRIFGYSLLGNPLSGLAVLLASPGKGVVFFSPVCLLSALGFSGLKRQAPEVARAVAVATVILFGFLSFVSFRGGDWCWGPRYLAPLLPLWALSLPFSPRKIRGLPVRNVFVGAGLVVQLLALSVDHQRFFFERALPDYFWAWDPGFYFRDSALFSRPGELMSLPRGAPAEARLFRPGPEPTSVTYCIFGNLDRRDAPRWMREFRVFYLPRPWPLWMVTIEESRRPIALIPWIAGLMAVACTGAALLVTSLRRPSPDQVP